MNGAPLDPEDSLFTPTAPARPSTRPEIPTDQAQIRSLRREAERARGNAGMLSEAVGFARSDELAGNELIQVRCCLDKISDSKLTSYCRNSTRNASTIKKSSRRISPGPLRKLSSRVRWWKRIESRLFRIRRRLDPTIPSPPPSTRRTLRPKSEPNRGNRNRRRRKMHSRSCCSRILRYGLPLFFDDDFLRLAS